MKVRLHNTNEMPAARVFRAKGEGHVIVGSKVTPSGDEYVVTFYPKVPGRYHLDLGGLAMDPAKPTTLVSLTPTYLIAVLAALLGSVLFAISVKDADEKKRWRRRIVLGVLTGGTFAVLHFNRSLIPGGMAFPALGETPILAAFWGGLAGGWIGPTALLLVIGRLLPGLPNVFGTAATRNLLRPNRTTAVTAQHRLRGINGSSRRSQYHRPLPIGRLEYVSPYRATVPATRVAPTLRTAARGPPLRRRLAPRTESTTCRAACPL